MFLLIVVSVVNKRRTCKSGGVELLDLHKAVAPRLQGTQESPTLLSFRFIPYNEFSLASSHLGTSVLEYADTCASFVLERMHHLLSSNVEKGLRNLKLMRHLVDETSWRPVVGEKLTEYLNSPDCVVFKTLEKIFAVARDDAFARNVNSVVSENWSDVVSRDRLFAFARCDICIKTCLGVVLENISRSFITFHINIVECDAGTGQAYQHVMRQLSSQPDISVSYTAADPSPTQRINADLAQQLGIDCVEWSLESSKWPFPERASKADLVILANVLHRHDNISAALSAAASLASDNGFLLIVEPTSNFAIPWSFFALTNDVTEMSDLSSRTCGPYCDEQTWTTMLTNVGLTPVAQKSDGVLHTVFLCRKLSSVSAPQAPKIIDVDDASFSWLEEVKAVMAEERNESDANCSVWLRASVADSGVAGMLNCLRREPNGSRLRYMYCESFRLLRVTTHVTAVQIYKTSLPKVIWEEGCVAALSHTYAVKSPKSTPSGGPIPKPTCLIPGPVRPMMPNSIRSAVFPQCTGHTDRLTDAQTDRSSTGKV